MRTIIRTTDRNARVTLPKAFASTTVIVEVISDDEVQIRKAHLICEGELRFREESPTVLSKRDGKRFLALLKKPAGANAALRRAVAAYERSVRRG